MGGDMTVEIERRHVIFVYYMYRASRDMHAGMAPIMHITNRWRTCALSVTVIALVGSLSAPTGTVINIENAPNEPRSTIDQ